MKKIKSVIFLLSLIFIAATPVSGQSFLEKMAKHAKKKAQQEAEKRSEKKIDEGIEKAFDNIEKKYSKEKKNDQSNSSNTENSTFRNNAGSSTSHDEALNEMMGKMGFSSTPVAIEDNYRFTSSVTMNFKTYTKNGKEESNGDMISYYNPSEKYIAYEFKDGNIKNANSDKTGLFILDMKNMSTIILSSDNGEQNGIAYGMGNMVDKDSIQKAMEGDTGYKKEEYSDNPYLKKTGRTKTIAGYKCEEYTYEDEDVISKFWITKDINWNNRDLMQNIFSSPMYSYATPNGFLMESEIKNKKTGEKNIYRVTNIKKNISKDIDITRYNITNLGNMKIPSNE